MANRSRQYNESEAPDWTYGLFGCFSNPVLCVATFVVPCVTFGLAVDDLQHKSCCLYGWLYLVPGLNCYMQSKQRELLRDKRAIPGAFSSDFCSVCWCTLCTLIQQTREVVELKSEETALEEELKRTSRHSLPPPAGAATQRYVTDPVPSLPRGVEPYPATTTQPTRTPYSIDISPPTQSTEEFQRGVHHDYDYPARSGQRSPAGYVNMRPGLSGAGAGTSKENLYQDMSASTSSMYVDSDTQHPDRDYYSNHAFNYDYDYDYEPVEVRDVGYNVI